MLNAVKPFIDFYRVASFAPAEPSPRGFWRAWQGIALGWQAAARYRRLAVMSDEELAQIGLDRASIGRHAYFGEPPFGRA
ncbi:MAG: hypothetical protein OEU92_01235 [Alphaproteobacteria bacterium]|nr:hypothetical protein [Alphaproteobacteria bacterium]